MAWIPSIPTLELDSSYLNSHNGPPQPQPHDSIVYMCIVTGKPARLQKLGIMTTSLSGLSTQLSLVQG